VPAALDQRVRRPFAGYATGIVRGGRGHGDSPVSGVPKACPEQ
jgi:hypothetical protein